MVVGALRHSVAGIPTPPNGNTKKDWNRAGSLKSVKPPRYERWKLPRYRSSKGPTLADVARELETGTEPFRKCAKTSTTMVSG